MGIPIFLASNDLYAPFVATTIASIMDHTKARVDFYIFYASDKKRAITFFLPCLSKLISNLSPSSAITVPNPNFS